MSEMLSAMHTHSTWKQHSAFYALYLVWFLAAMWITATVMIMLGLINALMIDKLLAVEQPSQRMGAIALLSHSVIVTGLLMYMGWMLTGKAVKMIRRWTYRE